ncbi:MAG: tetratricopeptide repeat protein [Bacteroidia bacterium]|nr:tetratricopeptide repeat protein [Bacteroidia bacterium]
MAKLCIYYLITGHYKEAEKYTLELRAIAKKTNNKKALGLSYNFMGSIYDDNGKYPEAIEAYLSAQKLFEEVNHKKGLSDLANNLGLVYFNIHDYEKSKTYFEKAIKLINETGMRHALDNPLHSLGQIYSEQKNYTKALEYYRKALALRIEFQRPDGLVGSYLGIGNIHALLNNNDSALYYHTLCLKVAKEMNEPKQLAFAESALGTSLLHKKNYAASLDHLNNAEKTGREADLLELLRNVYRDQSALYEATGNTDKALKAYKNYISARDSMFNEANTKKALSAELNFEFEKKVAISKAEQDKQNALHSEQSKRQKIVIGLVGVIALVIAVVVVVVLRSLRITKRQKKIIEEQKNQVGEAFEKLHEKNKEVMDSIYYARRIQRALITSERYINKEWEKIKS